jgi:hypothetical protein
MELFPKHIRIANCKKLVDRFITIQSKTAPPSSKKKMGNVYALIEILNPWHPNAQIGQTIINTFSKEYFCQSNTNELINFENSLKKVNEKLVEITQRGETDWIGKINAVLFIIKDNKLHLAYTGKVKAYLHRSTQILPIVGPQDTYTYNHPLKTFSSVISGELKLNDKIFFSTNLLFDYIDSVKLQQILTQKDIYDIGLEIASIYRSRNLRHGNSILIEMSAISKTDIEKPEVIYLDQEQYAVFQQNLKKYYEIFTNSLLNMTDHTKKYLSKSKKYYNETLLPQGKKFYNNTKQFAHTKLSNNSNKQAKKDHSPTTPQTSPTINYYNQSSKKVLLYLKKISDFVNRQIRKIIPFIKTSFKPKNKSKTFIIIAIVLLLLFIANIGYIKNINSNKTNIIKTTELLDELENKKDDALLAQLSNDQELAQNILIEIMDQLNSIQFDKSLQNRVDKLKEEISIEIDKTTKTTRLSNVQYSIDLDNFHTFDIGLSSIIAADSQNTIFSIFENEEQSTKKISSIPNSEGSIISITSKDNLFYIYTNKQKLFILDESNNLNPVQTEDNNWKNAITIKTYLSNIYLLDSNIGQIYRYTDSQDGFSKSSESINPNNVDIKNSIDMAIDGYIYILKEDGNIIKTLQGKPDAFNVNSIPRPNTEISDPKKIFTNQSIESIYILDGNRILELSKNGNFISQFAFEESIKDIKNFHINPKIKEIYILENNTLYKFNY